MAEDGRIDDAVRVCEEEARFDAADGTQRGYRARSERLRTKHSKANRDGARVDKPAGS